jgi:DNA-binding MarR family transcriptional regulator
MEGVAVAHERLNGLLFQLLQVVGLRTEWPFDHVTLTLPECVTLLALAEHGSLAQQDLADTLRVDKSRASRLGASLEERGWIERVREQANKRVYRIRLTAEGKRLAKRVSAVMHERHAAVFDAMSDDEREALATGLAGLTRALREHPFA